MKNVLMAGALCLVSSTTAFAGCHSVCVRYETKCKLVGRDVQCTEICIDRDVICTGNEDQANNVYLNELENVLKG